ncbi:MAG: hypothetical protein IPP29_21770 [Bacteroidetes bacterium]|nr:hypothetical protein [Bacteroidota bacterium]
MKKTTMIFSLMIFGILKFGVSYCQEFSQYGHTLPLHTNGNSVRIMMVFVEFVGVGAPIITAPNWPAGQLPLDKDEYVDPTFTNSPQKYISKLMWESSFGQFKVEGDYVNNIIQIDMSNWSSAIAQTKLILNTMISNSTLTFGHYNSLAEFDHFTIAGQSHFYPKPGIPNNYIDGLMICYRNHPIKICSAGSACIEWNTLPVDGIGGYGIDNACDFGMCGGIGGMEFIIEEYFHSMYGNNNWHAGAGGGFHTFPFQTNPWGLATQSAGAGITNIACGWDRDFCEWKGWSDLNKTLSKASTIMAKNVNTNADIVTDFDDITLYPNAQEFVLRDFVTYGDAIRIKLPHINCDALGKPKNQYLWIENHQLISMFDHGQWEYNSCKDPITAGMYCQIQVGKDIKDLSTPPFVIETDNHPQPNSAASWLFPLTAEGNYDFAYGTPFAPNVGCVWGNTTTPIDFYSTNTKPNPFTGFSDLYGRMNNNGDNLIDEIFGNDHYPPWHVDIDANSNLSYNSHFKGDGKDAFSFANNNTKLSICTNPSTTPVYTLLSEDGWSKKPNETQINANYENRTIWLNGVSVEILQENFSPFTFGQGAIKVRVKFDDYDVDRNVRWCGEIKLSPNDFNISNPSLVVKAGKEIQLDRGESPTQVYAYNANPPYVFTKPTYFTCLPNSITVMESNSKIIVDNGSTLHLNSNSKIEMNSGAQIIVKNNSKLILDPSACIKVNNGASIYIETGSTIVYDQAVVQLVGVNSVLDIAGTLDIKANSNFQCMGMVQGLLCNGFVRLSYPTTISSNVIAGNNCTMSFINTTVGKKHWR